MNEDSNNDLLTIWVN